MNAGQETGAAAAGRTADQGNEEVLDRWLRIILIIGGVTLTTVVVLLKLAATVRVTGLLLGVLLIVLGAVLHRVRGLIELSRLGLKADLRPSSRHQIKKAGSSAPLSEEGTFEGPFRVNLLDPFTRRYPQRPDDKILTLFVGELEPSGMRSGDLWIDLSE